MLSLLCCSRRWTLRTQPLHFFFPQLQPSLPFSADQAWIWMAPALFPKTSREVLPMLSTYSRHPGQTLEAPKWPTPKKGCHLLLSFVGNTSEPTVLTAACGSALQYLQSKVESRGQACPCTEFKLLDMK